MMTDIFSDIIWPGVAGLLIGLFFFGGLWLTLRLCLERPRAGLWFSLSLLLRVILSCVGIYFVAAPSPLRLLVCTLGFIVARIVLTKTRTLEKAYAYKS